MPWPIDLCGIGATGDDIGEVDIRGQDRIVGM